MELGTSNGYSTLWLADAARAAGGAFTSVEVDPLRSAEAGRYVRRAGLERFVEVLIEDAGVTLANGADDGSDFSFLDAERPSDARYWPDLRRTLAPRRLLISDNVISHAEQVADVVRANHCR